MKTVKIFLASSIEEFERERMALGNFIRTLNDHLHEWGIYCKLGLCENLSQAIADKRKQEEYNQEIRESRFFYALFGREAGTYTIEEFDVALAQYKASGAPQIFVYFKNLPEGVTPEPGLAAFKERLDRDGFYYSRFDSLDSIKLNMLTELARQPETGGLIRFEDGRATIDGKTVLTTGTPP